MADAVVIQVWEAANGPKPFSYEIAFTSGTKVDDFLGDWDELEAILRHYKLTEADVLMSPDCRRRLSDTTGWPNGGYPDGRFFIMGLLGAVADADDEGEVATVTSLAQELNRSEPEIAERLQRFQSIGWAMPMGAVDEVAGSPIRRAPVGWTLLPPGRAALASMM